MQNDKYAEYRKKAREEYVRSNGDVDATFFALAQVVPRPRIRKWAEADDWDSYVTFVRSELGAEFARREKERHAQNLKLVQFTKRKILRAMSDEIDPKTQKLVRRAAGAKSLEDCAKTLIELVKFEEQHLLAGEGEKKSPQNRSLSTLAENMQKAAGEAAKEKPKVTPNVDRERKPDKCGPSDRSGVIQ